MVILETKMFVVVAEGRVATCTLRQRPDVTAEEGADNAHQLSELLRHVVFPSSEYDGFLLDARDGPPVFGPATRDAIARMLEGASRHDKRLGVLVGSVAIQQLQYTSICNEVAPRISLVSDDESKIRKWLSV